VSDDSEAVRVMTRSDALTAPETFEPTSSSRSRRVVKGGYNNAGFGWYNVKPDPANPASSSTAADELYGMCSSTRISRRGAQVAGQSATSTCS